MLPQGLAELASVVDQLLDREDRAEDLCSESADLARTAFYYALHCILSWVGPVHLVHTADGQGMTPT